MNKKTIKISLDSDDTIFSTEGFIDSYGPDFFMKKFNKKISNEQGYNIQEMFDSTDKEQDKFWQRYFLTYLLCDEPIFNVKNTLEKLKQDDDLEFEFHIVTSLYKADDPLIGKVIRFIYETGLKRFGIFPYIEKIHYVPYSKDDNITANLKKDVFEEYDIDIVIEDKSETVLNLESQINTGEISAIVKATRNNQDFHIPDVKRLHTYNDVYSEIINLSNQILDNDYKPFVKVSGKKLKTLDTESKLEYYKEYRNYIKSLPFDKERVMAGEEYYKKMSKTLSFLYSSYYKPLILNTHNIPADKGVILISNHQTNKDLPLLVTGFKDHPFHPLLKEGFKDIPVVNSIVDKSYSVYLDRDDTHSRQDSLIELSKLIVNENNIWIAPEGTYTNKETNNLVDPFVGKGAFILSQMLDSYILPIALTQNYEGKERPIINILEPSKVDMFEDINDAAQRYYEQTKSGIIYNKEMIKSLERKYY